MALLNQGMNANCASYPKVSLGLGFKNPTREDSYLKSARPKIATDRNKFSLGLHSTTSPRIIKRL